MFVPIFVVVVAVVVVLAMSADEFGPAPESFLAAPLILVLMVFVVPALMVWVVAAYPKMARRARIRRARKYRRERELLDDDPRYGRLWRQKSPDVGGEPIVTVEVTEPYPDAAGRFQTHRLRVPPGCKTAHEAVAWTFGLWSWEYDPEAES